MKVNFDKKHVWFTIKFLGVANIIFFLGYFSAEQFYRIKSIQPDSNAAYAPSEQNFEYNPVFSVDSKTKPVFMPAEEILQKKTSLAWEKRDFIFADMQDMQIYLYSEGILKNTFKITAKGKEGGFFEIPSGFYRVQNRARTHSSKLDKAISSWNVYFFDNYFIHAEKPNTPDASGVGGIILAMDDAKKVFDQSQTDMPVLVYNPANETEPSFSFFRKTNLPHKVPEVSAAGALVEDLETGQILFEKNKTETFPIASISKLFTGFASLENLDAEKDIVISANALKTEGSTASLSSGEIIKLKDLLYGLILPSGNDAAVALSEQETEFVQNLNRRIKEIGLKKTNLQEPTGLNENNLSSAEDLLAALKYIYDNHPDFLALTREENYRVSNVTIGGRKISHVWKNINWPAQDPKYLGGKAGWTQDALQTMAGIYNLRLSEYGGRAIGIVMLGSRNRIEDIRAVINYLEQEYFYGSTPRAEKQVKETASIFEAIK